MSAISSGDCIKEDDLIMIGEIELEGGIQFFSVIREHLMELVGDPMLSMLDLSPDDRKPGGVDTVSLLVASIKFKNNPKVGVVTTLSIIVFITNYHNILGDCQIALRTSLL